MLTKCGSYILTAAIARSASKDFLAFCFEWQCGGIALTYQTYAQYGCDPCKVGSRRLEGFFGSFWARYGLYSTAQKSIPNTVAIIALIGEQQSGLLRWNGHQVFNCILIRSFSACENEAKRASQTAFCTAWTFIVKPPLDRLKTSL
jgi:hypothetical protein